MLHVYNTFYSVEKANRSITIGNFDGCHRGHQELITRAKIHAERMGLRTMVVTFEPHPRAFFAPELAARRLFSPEQKERILEEFGVDELLIQPFDAPFSKVSHESFFSEILESRLGMKSLVVGDDFRFGFRRLGDTTFLVERCRSSGAALEIVPPEVYGVEQISSSRIRRALEACHVEPAAAMLGRPYAIEGVVESGARIGRTLGIPTANLGRVNQLVPGRGVYAGRVWLSGSFQYRPKLSTPPLESFPAVFNVGSAPTVRHEHDSTKIEAHIIDQSFGADELYGQDAVFFLTQFIRPEKRFGSVGELKAQILDDIETARRLTARD